MDYVIYAVVIREIKKARDFYLGLNATFYGFLFNDEATKPDVWLKYDECDDGYLGLVKHLTPSLMQFQYYNESEIVVNASIGLSFQRRLESRKMISDSYFRIASLKE